MIDIRELDIFLQSVNQLNIDSICGLRLIVLIWLLLKSYFATAIIYYVLKFTKALAHLDF